MPSDWQAENRASAEVAITGVEVALRAGRQIDDAFIEEASSALHDKWLERNGRYAPPEQNKPYSELTKEEKEKDRVIIRKAIEACAERDFEPVNFQEFNEPGGFKDQYGLDSKLFVVKDRVYGTLKVGGYELEFNGEPTIDDINKLFSDIDRSFGYRGDKRHEDEVLSYGYMTPYTVVGRNIDGLYERLGIEKNAGFNKQQYEEKNKLSQEELSFNERLSKLENGGQDFLGERKIAEQAVIYFFGKEAQRKYESVGKGANFEYIDGYIRETFPDCNWDNVLMHIDKKLEYAAGYDGYYSGGLKNVDEALELYERKQIPEKTE